MTFTGTDLTTVRSGVIIAMQHPPGVGWLRVKRKAWSVEIIHLRICIFRRKEVMLMSEMNNEKKQALQALKTARGQIDGIMNMIEEGRYCIDISNQIFAASAMLKRANLLILKQHMNHCVLEAAEQGHGVEKIDEVIGILSKILDK